MTQFDIIVKIAQIIFPLVAIVLLGFFYAKKCQPDMRAANKMNIDVFCPALIFSVVSAKSFNLAEYQTLAIAALLIVLGSGVLALPFCYAFKVSPKTLAPPVMFKNTGNMGLPLVVLAFGEQALPIAVVFFIVENTLHFTVGTYLLEHRANPFAVLKMPMIFVTIVALLFSHWQIALPTTVLTPIELLGQISIPLMLFTLGVRMTSVNFADWKIGLLGAILTPACGLLSVLLLSLFWDFSTQELGYLLLFSVLPPAVLNYMIAEKFQQQPQQVASIVLIGNMTSVIVIPVTLFFIYQF